MKFFADLYVITKCFFLLTYASCKDLRKALAFLQTSLNLLIRKPMSSFLKKTPPVSPGYRGERIEHAADCSGP